MKKSLVIAGVMAATAWTAAADDVPKVGIYLGYEYVRFNSATDVPAVSANGAGGQLVVNFNNWFSGVADLGAVHNGNLNNYQLDSTVANFLFGPRVTLSHKSRVQPYFQILWGGVYAATSTQIEGYPVVPGVLTGPVTIGLGEPITARIRASQTAFAMTAGGGLDIRINRHVSFRPIGLDYYLTRLQNLRTHGDNNQDNLRYSTGFTFMFGGEKPAPPAPPPPPPPAPVKVSMKTCPDGSSVAMTEACAKMNVAVSLTATPSEICPGETAQVRASLSGGSPDQMSYSWSVNGQQTGQDQSFEFSSTGREPGTYHIGLAVNNDNFNPGSANAAVTVREYRPPTGTVTATPSQIHAGDRSALSSGFQGQCGGPIRAATYEASEGSIQGDQFDSSGVQFDATNNAEQKKTVTITAKASDGRNTGAASTTIEVTKSATIMPVRLPDVLFSDNSSRVNNCGKRVLLEQLRAYYERDAGGTAVLVGHVSSDEKSGTLAQQRASNAAAVITAGQGICLAIPQAQVQVSAPGLEQNGVGFEAGFCSSSVARGSSSATNMRRVEVWFVPSGGKLPASVTNNQSATALSLGGLGCPK